MFKINEDKSIYLTRGDIAQIEITALATGEEQYQFKTGEVVRIKVFEINGCDCVVLQKDTVVDENTTTVSILLEKSDTKIGDIISKPKDYWYEIELNPDTAPQTIIGYDEEGAKLFRLYPEGRDSIE